MIDKQVALAVGGGCIIKCPNKEKTVNTSFTLEDLRQLGIPARPRGPLFSHPEHGLDSHNWSVYLSSRGRFEAGNTTLQKEAAHQKLSLTHFECGNFVIGITHDCLALLCSEIAAGRRKIPPRRIHRAHLFPRRDFTRRLLTGPPLPREEFLDSHWNASVVVLCLKEENDRLESKGAFDELVRRVPNDIVVDSSGVPSPRWFSTTPSSFRYGKAERDLILGLAVDGK
jgi:hypothetical protein